MNKPVVLALCLSFLLAGCISSTDDSPQVTTFTTPDAPSTTQPAPVTPTTLEPQSTPTTVPEAQPTTTVPFILSSDATDCEGYEGDTLNTCLYELAPRLKDKSLCYKIGEDNVKLACLARLEDSPQFCKKIDVLRERDYCFRTMAFKWNKILYCDEIKDKSINDKCVHDFVLYKKPDPYRCFNIFDTGLRDSCILHHVGIDRINPSLCHLITDLELELECNQTYLK